MSSADAEAVIGFWRSAGPKLWFDEDEDFDRRFRQRFLSLHERAARRELDAWADDAHGMLALLLLLDQFPRNAFRGSAHMFATDPLARHFARLAIDLGSDQSITPELRMFCYLPFEHSEDPLDQALAVALMRTLGGEASAYAKQHCEVIQRFGRFPHRNFVLGRATTADEQAFLDDGGFAG